ncbi:hypothetical protein HYZ97_04000 [Candidatus Pacearchaeota archaeon]|nr:hypothetical protein [Candidatus Pacearchaeota archaeon]
MKLDKKKNLAARTLSVGKERIVFNTQRLNEIKEAITKQDIRDLVTAGAITLREINGRRTVVRRKNRRRAGSIRKPARKGKRAYVILTRKLRRFIRELLDQNKLTKENYVTLRKQIRMHTFKSKAHLKEHITHTE